MFCLMNLFLFNYMGGNTFSIFKEREKSRFKKKTHSICIGNVIEKDISLNFVFKKKLAVKLFDTSISFYTKLDIKGLLYLIIFAERNSAALIC